MNRPLFTSLLLIAAFAAKAQPLPIFNQNGFFRNYTEEQGLSSNLIRCFLQDSKGFIWIGTANGLNRFDGRQFVHFYNDPVNINSISGNVISCLAEDKQGNIWIGTEGGGLNCWLVNQKKMLRFKTGENGIRDKDIMSLYIAKDSGLWIGYLSQGWSRMHIQNGSFDHYKQQQVFIDKWGRNACNRANAIFEDAHDRIWVATGYGLCKQEKPNGSFVTYLDESNRFYDEDENHFITAKASGDSIIWLGTWACGLKQFDTRTTQFRSFLFYPGTPYAGNRNIVLSIAEKSKHEMWIASADKGLVSFNTLSKTFTFYPSSPLDPFSPLPNECRTVMQDQTQSLWAGFDKGFSFYTPYNQNFVFQKPGIKNVKNIAETNVIALYKDSSTGQLFFSIEGTAGIFIKDKQGNTRYELLPDNASKYSASIFEIKKWDASNLLLNTSNGFLLYNLNDHSFQHCKGHFNGKDIAINGIASHQLNNYCWIVPGNENAFLRLEKTSGILTRYTIGGTFNESKPYYVFAESDSITWLGTRNEGLLRYNTNTYTADTSYLAAGLPAIFEPKKMLRDPKGHLWISTFSGGLYEMWPGDNNKYHYRHYGFAQGLLNQYCNLMAFDHTGNIWMATRKGLVTFNPLKPQLKSYTQTDGYRSDWYNINALFIDETNTLYAGVNDGFVQLDINAMHRNNVAPRIQITSFKIFDKPWNDSININSLKNITLNYKQNFFSFEFAALNFINPEQNKYAYKLDGVDAGWIYPGTRNYAAYSDLSPGHYTLHIKAANNDDVWNNKGISLEIHITPPYWQTYWFYALMALLVISIIITVYKYRIAAIKKEEKLKTSFNTMMAEIEMKALKAQMNPHFIFNCLNSINLFILKNDTDKASGYLSKFSKLIRLILDNSIADSNTLDTEIQAVQLYIEMEKLRFDSSFIFSLEVKPPLVPATILIPSMLIQPYVENAIWHGLLHRETGGGKLLLQFQLLKENLLQVIIEDNGVGRAMAQEYKSKKVLKHKSYGMRISNDRLRLITATQGSQSSVEVIDLANNGIAAGTKVILMIPVQKTNTIESNID